MWRHKKTNISLDSEQHFLYMFSVFLLRLAHFVVQAGLLSWAFELSLGLFHPYFYYKKSKTALNEDSYLEYTSSSVFKVKLSRAHRNTPSYSTALKTYSPQFKFVSCEMKLNVNGLNRCWLSKQVSAEMADAKSTNTYSSDLNFSVFQDRSKKLGNN